MYKIVFSATGRTEKVADGFCSAFDTVDKIDLSEVNFTDLEIPEGEICLVAAPVYGGVVPAPAVENIKKIKGNGAKAVVMVVYGNRAYDNALAQLKDVVEKAGFTVCGAVAAVAQHSMMPQVAANRPDENDLKELKEFGLKVISLYSDGQLKDDISVPGTAVENSPAMPVHPKATADCTGCGLCADKCPAAAIPKDKPVVTDKNKCITCMRCVEICPQNARVFMPAVMKAAGAVMKKVWGKHIENEYYI